MSTEHHRQRKERGVYRSEFYFKHVTSKLPWTLWQPTETGWSPLDGWWSPLDPWRLAAPPSGRAEPGWPLRIPGSHPVTAAGISSDKWELSENSLPSGIYHKFSTFKEGKNIKILRSHSALAAVAQRIMCQPANQKLTGLVPGQGARLGSCPDLCERQLIRVSLTHRCFSPTLPPPLPFSLSL